MRTPKSEEIDLAVRMIDEMIGAAKDLRTAANHPENPGMFKYRLQELKGCMAYVNAAAGVWLGERK